MKNLKSSSRFPFFGKNSRFLFLDTELDIEKDSDFVSPEIIPPAQEERTEITTKLEVLKLFLHKESNLIPSISLFVELAKTTKDSLVLEHIKNKVIPFITKIATPSSKEEAVQNLKNLANNIQEIREKVGQKVVLA